MDISINFDGIFGIFIFFAVAAALALVFVVSAIAAFVGSANAERAARFGWARCVLYSSAILLAFDWFVLMIWLLQKDKTIIREQGKAFDSGMFFFWLPLHLVALFVIAYAFRVRQKRKAELDRFVGRRR